MSIARRIARVPFDAYRYIIGSRFAARKLKRLTGGCDVDVDQLVDLAFSFEYTQNFLFKLWVLSIKPLQIKSEIAALCRIVQELDPKVIVEVGTSSGGTLFLFAHVADPEKVISVDLPRGYQVWKIPFFKSFGGKQVIQLIRGDSHREETFEKLKTVLKGREVDFLFIDGDHSYDGVKQDFQMYSRVVRKGGIVAFHDIVEHDPKTGCQVDRFWHEVKQTYRHLEIADQSQKWAGIGVLYL